MKVAVVTPYYRESTAILAECHLSVQVQSHSCRHYLVADGFPNPTVRTWPVTHLELPTAHGDGGSAARYAGAMAAIADGADAVAFLDADNWFQPDHIATMVAVTTEAGADIGTAHRTLHRPDGTLLGIDNRDSIGTHFADTSCLFVRRAAFDLIEVWRAMPASLGPICDVIVSLAHAQRSAKLVHSPKPTVCYRTTYAPHFQRHGEAPPAGLGDKMLPIHVARAVWNSLPLADRRRIVLAGDPTCDLAPPWPEDRPDQPPAYRRNLYSFVPGSNPPQPVWVGHPLWQCNRAALAQGRLGDAAEALRGLLIAYPDDAVLLFNRAVLLTDLGRLDETAATYRRLGLVSPPFRPRALSGLLRVAQLSGNPDAVETAANDAVTFLESGLETISDVPILKYFAYRRVFTPDFDRFGRRLGMRIAALLGTAEAPPRPAIRPARLTIGYLSGCFGDHPIGHVTRDLYRQHDRERFRIIGFSGRDRSGEATPFNRDIRNGLDGFHEIGALSAPEAAARIRAERVDLLVALDGHMDWSGAVSSPDILAQRAAPLQASWLGVASSMDLPFIDWLIADDITVPEGEERLFAEHVMRLPGCFHCASPHEIAPTGPSRAECGLPEGAVVFAGFNNIEKIDRAALDLWMPILADVPGSVLWLTDQRQFALTQSRLRAAVEEYGIAGDRLIFAARLPDKSRHLARHAHADLLLDTPTFNASTTALDALWAGLPVLTLKGSRFAARLAESFLRNLALDELVAADSDAFIRLAVAYGQDAQRRAELRARVRQQVAQGPLFDMAGFARKLETAYDAIWAAR
ncbi:MAG: glycosyltransferase [Aliidongia sp.]